MYLHKQLVSSFLTSNLDPVSSKSFKATRKGKYCHAGRGTFISYLSILPANVKLSSTLKMSLSNVKCNLNAFKMLID